MKQKAGTRCNRMSALVSNYKGFVDKGASRILVWFGSEETFLNISDLSFQFWEDYDDCTLF